MPRRPTPSLITGTSSEYLGRRPMRQLVRERPLVVIVGPAGVGKTSVARRIGSEASDEPLYLDSKALGAEVADSIRQSKWRAEVLRTASLILDGPTWLRARPGMVDLLIDLLTARVRTKRRTIVCDVNNDGSVQAILAGLRPGSAVILGLRFPSSRSGRLRFARRCCDELGLPRSQARGTDQIEPWGYEAVIGELVARRDAAAE